MDSVETRKMFVQAIAQAMQERSVLAPHVAQEIAEVAVVRLVASGEYLITGCRIHQVQLFDEELDSKGEPMTWYVQPVQTASATEESNGTDGS